MIQMIAMLLTSLVLAAPVARAAGDNLKAFPPAEKGMTRYVLELPKADDEAAAQIELLVGKTVRTDAHNRYFFGGKIAAETIQGWGYPRYLVRKFGPMAGTLMAVDPSEPRVERFITLGGPPFLIPYNSRLPVVVYVPAGVEVRYRIWRAEPEPKTMAPG